MLADDSENDIVTMVNAEASAEIPFGVAVSFKTSSPASDRDAVLPSTSELKVRGIVVHSHDYARTVTLADGSVAGELGSTGLRPGAGLQVLVKGAVWVRVQQAVVPGAYICKTANTVYTAKGQLGNADESSNTIDATKVGLYETAAAAGGLARLRVDFTVKL
jgi:hypothetical protein